MCVCVCERERERERERETKNKIIRKQGENSRLTVSGFSSSVDPFFNTCSLLDDRRVKTLCREFLSRSNNDLI